MQIPLKIIDHAQGFFYTVSIPSRNNFLSHLSHKLLDALPQSGNEILANLANQGIEARYVGGVVRDALLGIHTKDIDIAVNAAPETLLEALESLGYTPLKTGFDHGTLTIMGEDAYKFELTSLRKDSHCDGRHAKVTYTNSWEEDALRRDFTINALYAAPNGEIYDYARGREDLENGVVRFVGEPGKRIQEDYLRILRFYRFTAWFGKSLDEAGHYASIALAPNLVHLSRERVQNELMKLLMAPSPELALKGLEQTKIDTILWSVGANWDVLQGLLQCEAKLNINPNPYARLYALLQKPLAFWKAHFRFSARQLQILEALHSGPTQAQAYNIYHFGFDLAQQISMVAVASGQKSEGILSELNNLPPSPVFPLRAVDLIELGIAPGPRLGYILRACTGWWVDHNFTPQRDACLDFCRDLMREP